MSGETGVPPRPRRGDHVHREHGIPRPDPYVWMRDAAREETRAHLDAERHYYDAAMAPLEELVVELALEAAKRTAIGVVDGFSAEDGDYRIERRGAGRVLTRTDAAGTAIVLDPTTAPGLDGVFPDAVRPSPDGRLLAYAHDPVGLERYELRVIETTSGAPAGRVVRDAALEFAWAADSASLVYLRHDAAFRPCEVRLHRLGTDPRDDALLLSEPDPRFQLRVRLTRTRNWIVVTSTSRVTRQAWLIDATRPEDPPRAATPRRDGVQFDVEDAPGGGLLVVSDHAAPEFQLWFAPPGVTDPGHWEPLTEPDATTRLHGVEAFARHLVLRCRRDGSPLIRVMSWPQRRIETELAPLLPGGTLRMQPTTRIDAEDVTVVEESYVHPPVWHRVELATGVRERLRAVRTTHRAEEYRSERRTVPARDGTGIPVTIAAHRDTPLDGSAPALLYSYGAYESCFEPEFDPSLPGLLDRGMVFVHAHIRGGGERGRRWWLQGRLAEKENSFTDLFDVAKALAGTVVDGSRLATRGMSAGGLVQGVALSRRPELWRAVVAEVPWVDVVTSMCDESVPLTVNERDEWGDPRRLEEFRWMLAYSPYDRLPPPGGRPAVLVTGAVNDTRVLVHEPAKWVAALRHSDPGWGERCLFRCETGAGSHAGPQTIGGRARYEAELAAWTLAQLDAG